MDKIAENANKAMQCADLLLQDLQELNRSGDAMVSLLILPEIEKVAGVRARIAAVVAAVEHKNEDAIQPAP